MKKPEELTDLLVELKEEINRPSAGYETDRAAKVVVYIGRGSLTLTPNEAIFLLHNANTVERFYESIGCPDDSGVELHGMEVSDEVKEALDYHFSTVDEL